MFEEIFLSKVLYNISTLICHKEDCNFSYSCMCRVIDSHIMAKTLVLFYVVCDCLMKTIANLCLLFSVLQKGRLHYICPVGWLVGQMVGVTINFPSPNVFLHFLLGFSSSPKRNTTTTSNNNNNTNIQSLLLQCPAGTRTRPDTRYFIRYPTRPDSVLKIIG